MRILFFAAALVIAAVTAMASDVMGIYALIDKVVLEPNDTDPERIQIWGSFLVADGHPGDGFNMAERGYMYFALPSAPNSQKTAKAEWNDLKQAAGTGLPVGFGGRYSPKGKVRKPNEKPQTPETYPLNIGVVKLPRTDMIDQLRNAR